MTVALSILCGVQLALAIISVAMTVMYVRQDRVDRRQEHEERLEKILDNTEQIIRELKGDVNFKNIEF